MQDMLTKAKDRSTSMCPNSTATTDTGVFPEETSTNSSRQRENSTVKAKNATPPTSPSGKKPPRSISCTGPRRGEKYLGTPFDIHGGGIDLKFPHHECEIAQSVAHNGHHSVNYWMHNNMITIDGQKMGKSKGNFITLEEFFTGNHPKLEQPYSPMTIRFFILQAHYRGTVDFSNEALKGAEKALARMTDGYKRLQTLKPSDVSTVDVSALEARAYEAMDDDLNTPTLIGILFDAVRIINAVNDGSEKATAQDIEVLKKLMDTFLVEILGIRVDNAAADGSPSAMKPYEDAVDLLLEIRGNAKKAKDWTTSDLIRDRLAAIGFDVKDTKDGFEWSVKK